MNYEAALDYLYSLGHEILSMKLGLENITKLIDYLGRPDQLFSSVHVAGTNAKGSFCAMLASIMAQTDLKTGLYTSPHLIELQERFRINLKPADREQIAASIEKIKFGIDTLLQRGMLQQRPTFFEHVTACCFNLFAENRVELAILEVGLGGRLDSTNVVKPLLSVITPIGLDHQQFLGRNIRSIASEKAGIIKNGIPVLVGLQKDEAYQVIEARARETGSKLFRLDSKRLQSRLVGDAFWRLDLETENHHYKDLLVGLRGEHQVATAALAILAAEYLAQTGLSITAQQIAKGIEQAKWPGRLQMVATKPNFFVDGAHNISGAEALASSFKEFGCFSTSRKTLLLSIMQDKDIEEIAQILLPFFDRVILVKRPDPRSFDPEIWTERLRVYNSSISIAEAVADAIDLAYSVTPQDGLIFATGSLYFVAEILKQFSISTDL